MPEDNSGEWGSPHWTGPKPPAMERAEIVDLKTHWDAERIFDEARAFSIMGPKLRPLIAAARQCIDVPGDVAEVGVYRGGSGLALCRVFDKKVFLIDTFTGIPQDDIAPAGHKAGDFADTSFGDVCAMLDRKKVRNAIPVQGDICSQWLQQYLSPKRFAFIHLDADIEQSTVAAVNFFLPRLSPGAGMFFDDYNNERCPAVKPAVEALMQTGKFTISIELGTAFLKVI